MKPQFDPFSLLIQITSEENFYLVQSSNKFDVYGVLLTGHNSALCSCPAATLKHLPCKHRAAVLQRFPFVTPDEDTMTDKEWQAVKARIETLEELEAVHDLFNEAA